LHNYRKEESVKEHTTIAVDLSKSVFEVAISREPGRVCQRRRLLRSQMTRFFAQRPPATVLLEACGSSHHWARQIESLGHRVLLLPPHHTRRYVLRDKTDRADATALLEAHRNEQIAPVPVKTLQQQSLAALHRLRSGWLATRTAPLQRHVRPRALNRCRPSDCAWRKAAYRKFSKRGGGGRDGK
jgi:transposase